MAADLSPGLQLKSEGRLVEAEAVFRTAVSADPYDVDAATQLATVVGWQGRHEEAEGLWRRAVSLRPADPDLRTGLARVRWWRGDAAGAADELAEMRRLYPKHAEAAALQQDIDRAMQRLFWRVDAGALSEHFTDVYGDARSLSTGLSATWRGFGSLSGGVTRRSFDLGNETTWRAGLGAPLGGSAVIEIGGEVTDDPVLAARAALSADVSWRVAKPLEPVFGWRRTWYAGDRIDLVRPGIRWFPLPGDWSGSQVEARALIADSPLSGINGGGALRLIAQHANGWSASVGGAIADEAEPPNQPTRVTTTSLGVAYASDAWGFRVDWDQEDRRNEWTRTGLSVGGHLRW